MKRPLTRPLLTAALSAVCLCGAANATITVDGTPLQFEVQGGGGLNIAVANFDASGSDKLVVVISTEHGFNNSMGRVDDVQYNGASLTEAVQEDGGLGTTAIFYLDDPGAAGAISVSASNPNGGIGAVYALSGTAEGVGPVAKAIANSVSLATAVPDSLVIATHNNSGNPNFADLPTADAPLVQGANGTWGGARRWGGHASGYQFVPGVTTVTPAFTSTPVENLSTAAAAFEPGLAAPRFEITSIDTSSDLGMVTLAWRSGEGEVYTVRYSTDLVDWGGDLSDNVEAVPGVLTTETFDISGIPNDGELFFRVQRN